LKTITTSLELNNEFDRLIKNYDNFYWAIAWSDFDFKQSDLLVKNAKKIKKISVGLKFYGTSIKFIKKFKSHTGVNFVMDKIGTYHPKLYIFQNNDSDFEILIGSVNFTSSAFNNNTEFSILINSKDVDSKQVYIESMDFILAQWNKGVVLTNDFIKKYADIKNKIKPNNSLPTNGIFKPIYSKSWQQYLNELYKEDFQSRIDLLNWVNNKFNEQPRFDKMDLKTRKSIAGFGEDESVTTGFFGSTGARGYFTQSIIERPEIITKALSKIPKQGLVTKADYNNFINVFKNVSKVNELACATRLLCLWRPDYFVNFNGINADSLSRELRISKSKVNYETYWDLIVEPLHNSDWSKNTHFSNKKEIEVFSNRIALLDCIHSDFNS
jgi:hypothetical protein